MGSCCSEQEAVTYDGYYEGIPGEANFAISSTPGYATQSSNPVTTALSTGPNTVNASIPYGQGDARGSLVDSLQGLSSLPGPNSSYGIARGPIGTAAPINYAGQRVGYGQPYQGNLGGVPVPAIYQRR